MQIRLTKVVGIEWYDGWVVALVHSTDSAFLCFAVAINADQNKRLTAMCKIARKLADEMAKTLTPAGFSSELVSLWRVALGAEAIYLSFDDMVVDSFVTATPATDEQIVALREYELPVAEIVFLDQAIKYWFDS